jgi:hypothetical protein
MLNHHFVSLQAGARSLGVLMLRDAAYGAADEKLRDIQVPVAGADASEGPEPPAPAPFEWTIGQYY